MANDFSRIFASQAKSHAVVMSYKDFESDFSETTFMDQVTRPATLKGT